MSGDPETTRIVRSWLDEGVTELPDRVLDAVLDQVPATPQRRATWWPVRRLSSMNTSLKFGVAAVIVAVAALIGFNYFGTANLGGPGPDDSTPTPEPTPVATPEPSPQPSSEGNLTLGQAFSISLPGTPIAVRVTIPADDWWGEPRGGVLLKDDAEPPGGAGVITFVDEGYYVYGDPCQWSTTRPDTPATTVDELVAALSAQESRGASAPVDIALDGYAGKSITLHVPDDADFAECDDEKFGSWGVPGDDPARYHQGNGQIDELWIVDVDGHVVVIDTSYYAGTPQTTIDELQAMVESVTFD